MENRMCKCEKEGKIITLTESTLERLMKIKKEADKINFICYVEENNSEIKGGNESKGFTEPKSNEPGKQANTGANKPNSSKGGKGSKNTAKKGGKSK